MFIEEQCNYDEIRTISSALKVPFGKHDGKPIWDVPIAYLDSQVPKWERNCFSRQVEFVLDFLCKTYACHGRILNAESTCTIGEAMTDVYKLINEAKNEE